MQAPSASDTPQHDNRSCFFSVITATLNARRTIQWCIDSVSGQTFTDFEHILIDGASTDGTAEFLAGRRNGFSVYISEPDAGIYAAWNKALRHATGRWILFLSSDDALADRHVLANMHDELQRIEDGIRFVYGDEMYVSVKDYSDLMYVTKPPEWICRKFSGVRLVLPPHRAAFHHRDLFRDYGLYDESYRISADSKFMMRVLLVERFLHVPHLVTRVTLEGVTSRFPLVAYRENLRAMRELGLMVPFWRRVTAGAEVYFKFLLYHAFGRRTAFRITNAFRKLQGKPALRGR